MPFLGLWLVLSSWGGSSAPHSPHFQGSAPTLHQGKVKYGGAPPPHSPFLPFCFPETIHFGQNSAQGFRTLPYLENTHMYIHTHTFTYLCTHIHHPAHPSESHSPTDFLHPLSWGREKLDHTRQCSGLTPASWFRAQGSLLPSGAQGTMCGTGY